MIPAPAILGQLAVMAKEMPKAGQRQETLRSIAHSSMWRLDMSDLEHVRPMLCRGPAGTPALPGCKRLPGCAAQVGYVELVSLQYSCCRSCMDEPP